MEQSSNPVGNEAHEISPRLFGCFSPWLFRGKGTAESDCTKSAILRCWRIVKNVHRGRAGLVRQASRLRRCCQRNVQTSARQGTRIMDGFNGRSRLYCRPKCSAVGTSAQPRSPSVSVGLEVSLT